MSHYVILDRDGVINRDSDAYIKSPEEWIPIEGSLEAISRLKHAGYRIAIATNQSGIGRGLYNLATLNAIHQKMHQMLAQLGAHIDFIAFCPHVDADHSSCRKPLPGLYQRIAHRWKIKLNDVPVIGDSRRDLEAALAVQARPILVKTGKGRHTSLEGLGNVPVFENLQQAVHALIKEQ